MLLFFPSPCGNSCTKIYNAALSFWFRILWFSFWTLKAAGSAVGWGWPSGFGQSPALGAQPIAQDLSNAPASPCWGVKNIWLSCPGSATTSLRGHPPQKSPYTKLSPPISFHKRLNAKCLHPPFQTTTAGLY